MPLQGLATTSATLLERATKASLVERLLGSSRKGVLRSREVLYLLPYPKDIEPQAIILDIGIHQ